MAAPPSGDSAAGRSADVGLRPLVGSAYGCAVLHLGLYAGDLRSTGGRETVRRGAGAAGTASRSADRAPRRSVGHRRQCARTGRLAAIRRTGRQRFPALAGRARCCNSVRIQVRAARSPFPSTDRVGGGEEPTLRPAAGGGRAHRRGRDCGYARRTPPHGAAQVRPCRSFRCVRRRVSVRANSPTCGN